MDTDRFELFATLLEKEKVYMDPGVTFRRMCKWIGVEPSEADAFLMEELGYHGDDILKAYREGNASYMHEKYGIELCRATASNFSIQQHIEEIMLR